MTQRLIELEDLQVRLGGRVILKGLTGALSGRAVGLLGPNGAGKTTLIHTLLGFHRPSGGTARIFGRDIRQEITEIQRITGYMPESDSFIGPMTGVRFVRMMAELSGLPPAQALERAHETLFYVGLGEARYRKIASFSTGMKQLVKLAQAIVHGPSLLFLDEPTNGLDPPARQRMLELVRQIRESGQTRVVLSSHLLRDVEDCCDEVLVLKAGNIAVHCDLEAERRTHRRFLELEVRGADESFLVALENLGCENALHGPQNGRQRIKTILPPGVEPADLYRIAHQQRVQIRRLSFKRDSLEDIFLQAMQDSPPAVSLPPESSEAVSVAGSTNGHSAGDGSSDGETHGGL